MTEEATDLGTYRGYRLFAYQARRGFRGYAVADGRGRPPSQEEGAFAVAASSLEQVAERLRALVDEELALGTTGAGGLEPQRS